MQKDDSSQPKILNQQNQEATFSNQCIKWFKTSRKARKQLSWTSLYTQAMQLLMPDFPLSQLMVPDEILQECIQLLLNSFVYMERKEGACFVEHLANDVLLVVEGRLKINQKDLVKEGPIALLNIPLSRNQKIKMTAETPCIVLRGQRKQLQKFRNDVTRQDREKKSAFLSQYLFCGLTPVYPLTAVKLFTIGVGKIVSDEEHLLVLRSGLVTRHCKGKKEGSQLTAGCLVSSAKINELMELPVTGEGQWFQSSQKCELVGIHIDEFMRIVKLNPQLRRSLQYRLNIIFNQRRTLAQKNIEIASEFNEQFKLGTQTVRKHYPIEFKARPKTALAGGSFRRKCQTTKEDNSLADFITFDRYDKMMASKERVVVTKASYQMEAKCRTIIPVNYEKKIKQQNKMMKLQSGKIQKLSMRDSKSNCSRIDEIKKNLFRVTHLFDQPMDPNMNLTPQIKPDPNKPNNQRTSALKPEQFLKEEYLAEYYRRSTGRISLRDLDMATPSSNKENSQTLTVPSHFRTIAIQSASKTDTNFGYKRRGQAYGTVFRRVQ